MSLDRVDSMNKRRRESVRAHRAMLLWGMQDNDRRSVRAAARSVNRAESTVREWRSRWEWETRCQGELIEVKCQAVYRKLYYEEFKLREVIEVESNMSAPFMPDTPVPASVAESVAEQIKPDKKKEKEKERELMMAKRHVTLVDGALGYIAGQLQDGAIRASLRDIPLLLKMRQELTGGIMSSTEGGGIAQVLETTRVRFAKESGGDILAAMHEDALELASILGALAAAKRMSDAEEAPVQIDEVSAK